MASYLSFNSFKAVKAGTAPTVSWYWQGATRTNYSLTVNTGSALVLGCLATSVNNRAAVAAGAYLNPSFVLTKGSVPTVSVTTANTAPFALTATGSTLLWDSVNGHAAGYDYILAIPNAPVQIAAYPASGYLQVYIPSLSQTDAGLYYCTFYDASSATAAATGTGTLTTGSSSFFSLTITTKSGSGSSKSAQRNKAFEYSIALLGASKMLF